MTVIGSAGMIGLAGCSTDAHGGSNKPGVRSYSFTKIDSEDAPEETEVTSVQQLSDGSIETTIKGIVRVRNGCIDIRLGSNPEMTSDSDPVRVETMIGTYKPEDSDMCTQAIKPIGYKLRINCDPKPEEIVVSQAGENSQVYTLKVPDPNMSEE